MDLTVDLNKSCKVLIADAELLVFTDETEAETNLSCRATMHHTQKIGVDLDYSDHHGQVLTD